jgi:hypothetical protein
MVTHVWSRVDQLTYPANDATSYLSCLKPGICGCPFMCVIGCLSKVDSLADRPPYVDAYQGRNSEYHKLASTTSLAIFYTAQIIALFSKPFKPCVPFIRIRSLSY